MNSNLSVDIGLMEGRTFIIGRNGDIYIDSRTASKQHAEIKIFNGRIYLRDLNSSNGTFLVKNRKLVYFEEGYVSPLQPIMIGGKVHTVQSLLAIAGDSTASEDATTLVESIKMTVNSRV